MIALLNPSFINNAVILLSIALFISCNKESDSWVWVGQLESERIELSAESFEPIVQINVREGQTVLKNTLLVQQTAEKIDVQLSQADALVAQAQARVAELEQGATNEAILAAEARLQGAQYEKEFAELELTRAQELHQKQLGSQEQTDIARAKVNATTSQAEEASALLAGVIAGYTTEQITQAQQAVALARAERELLMIQQARLNHAAPNDAVIDQVLFSVGERPQIGQPIVTLLSGEQPYARVYIPEAERASVAIGMAVSVHVDGVEQAIKGNIRWVSNEPSFTPYFALTEQDRSRLSYLAKVDLIDVKQRLPDGLPVQVYPTVRQ